MKFRDCAAAIPARVPAAPTGVLCPNSVTGSLYGGRDFDGAGPQISMFVSAAIAEDEESVIATIDYYAASTNGATLLTDSFTRTIYEAPAGTKILSIDSETESSISALSPAAGGETPPCNDGDTLAADAIDIVGGLVQSVSMIGDTGGNDVSDDLDCDCDTRVDDIVFADLDLTLQRTAPPVCPELATNLSVEPIGVFRLRNDPEEPMAERTWLVPNGENVSADPMRLGPVASNVVQARYSMGPQRSAYLFRSGGVADIGVGFTSATFLQLPHFDPGSPAIVTEGTVPYMWVDTDATTDDWHSFRIYDSGACSILVAWGSSVLPDVPAFVPALATEVDMQFAKCGEAGVNEEQRLYRVKPLVVTPTYRSLPGGDAGALGIDDDRIHVESQWSAAADAGCSPVTVDVAFEFSLGVQDGQVVATMQDVSADLVGDCIAGGMVESQIVDSLTSGFPPALSAAFNEALVRDPTLFEIDPASIPNCETDADCEGVYPGPSACVQPAPGAASECWVRIDVDGLNVRPEGIELVFIEDETDEQLEIVAGADLIEAATCGPGRAGAVLVSSPFLGGTAAFTVPAVTSPSCPAP